MSNETKRYTVEEERWNAISHSVGIAGGIIVSAIFLKKVITNGGDAWDLTSVLLYMFGDSIVAVDMFTNLFTTNTNEAGELLSNIWPMVMFVVVVVMMLMLFFQQFQRLCQGILALDGLQQLGAGKLIPGSGDDDGGGILFTQQCHAGIQLVLLHTLGTAEDDGAGVFDLIVIELAEVLHIDFNLAGVSHSNSVSQFHIVTGNLFNRCNHSCTSTCTASPGFT